jgi:hypothetical protein
VWTSSQSDAYQSGYKHGVSDGRISECHDCRLYILEPGKGFQFHTKEFISGYINGFLQSRFPLDQYARIYHFDDSSLKGPTKLPAPGAPYIKETYPAIKPAAIYRFDDFVMPGATTTLPCGAPIPPQPQVPGTAPDQLPPRGKDPIGQFCKYFKWVPVGDDCNMQVIVGATVIVLGGALLFRLIKPKSAD